MSLNQTSLDRVRTSGCLLDTCCLDSLLFSTEYDGCIDSVTINVYLLSKVCCYLFLLCFGLISGFANNIESLALLEEMKKFSKMCSSMKIYHRI